MKLTGNRFVIPVEGKRDVEGDIFLGLEIVRNRGKIDELSDLFQRILKMEMPKPNFLVDIEDSYRYIEELITSA